MEILNKIKSEESNFNLTQYTFGTKKAGILRALFFKRKSYDRYWIDLIECYYHYFRRGTIEVFLEIKHPLGAFKDFENEFKEILKNNSIYYQNKKGFIVIREINLITLKKFISDYYDQGLIILMSRNRLNVEVTDKLIERMNLNEFDLKESISLGFNMSIEFNFPSGKEIYIASNLEDEWVEKCFKSIKIEQ